MSKEVLTFDKFTVELDSENLRFNEATLNKYIQTEGGYYDNYGAYLSLAEKNLQNFELQHERVLHERFVETKDEGGSDKLAEAKAKCDPIVVELKQKVNDAKYIVNRLKQHLKAWDKNHDNAQSLGHMQRKIMDKLNGDIKGSVYMGVDDSVAETLKSYESEENKEVKGMFSSNLNNAFY